MPFNGQSRQLPSRFQLVLNAFLQHAGLPFADTLDETAIHKAFDDEGVTFAADDAAVYTPAVTLWAFLSQVLFKGEQRSCLAAVARVIALRVALCGKPCAGNTGAYCRGRSRLPEYVIRQLAVQVAVDCEEHIDDECLWHGRHVYLADGTTATMPDTPANQAVYPQNPQQAEGLGFPIVRMVVLISLATAMLTSLALAPYVGKQTGEPALLREQLDRLGEGDVVLFDRYYCSFFMLAELQSRGVDVVARVHARRKVDFRRGRRLADGDHIVEWLRPQRPGWMDEATYERMPATIELREFRVNVPQPGIRVESFVVATTLTDATAYSHDEVAELYRHRWQVELDIRAIKQTMGMDVLRCKTPAMVRKEIWTCLLAYNLLRRSLLQSAQAAGVSPRTLSFTAALQSTAASWMLSTVGEEGMRRLLTDATLTTLAKHVVGNRPDRVEPRAVKRRPKEMALLTQPRANAREALLKRRAS